MQVPTFFYGYHKSVKSDCKKLVKQLLRGDDWGDLMSSQVMIDTKESSGLIVLRGPDPLIDSYGPQFHWYVLLDEIYTASAQDVRSRPKLYKQPVTIEMKDLIFNDCLQRDWGTLGLISYENVGFFLYSETPGGRQKRYERYKAFLIACSKYWNTFISEGSRYSDGSSKGEDLWSLHTTLKYVLANMGVSVEVLNSPLPAGGLEEVLALVQANQ